MGSSSGEASAKAIDASVGGLVWVRRRNGSWWPGRIMGLDEVSESCLVSPRSGTPVKLLGREDASVDWYNLEKSKRVKSFRCGEYDECIAKAKASAANSSKKAVKYARREDAIIHALEIENSRLVKGPIDFNGRTGDLSCENGECHSVSESANPDDDVDADDVSDSGEHSDSAQDLSQSGLSFEEPNHVSSSKVQSMQGRRRTPNDSEDDGTEGVKRMRGLQDLGIVTASKRKVQAGGLLELVQQENASLSDLNNGKSFSNGNSINGMKRKRTPVVNAHEIMKKKNRRRPLTKVLESTAMVSVPVFCNQSVLESTDTKRSNSVIVSSTVDCNGVSGQDRDAINAFELTLTKEREISSLSGVAEGDSSERLFDVPLIGDEKQSEDPFCEKPLVVGLKQQSSQNNQVEGLLVKNEGVNETGPTSSGAAVHTSIGQRLEKGGTSKWQSKGKRNTRKLSRIRRRHMDMDDEPEPCNGISGPIPVSVEPEDPEASGPPPLRLLPYRQSRSMVHFRYRAVDLSDKNLLTDSSLIEVKVEVKASYRPPHVPLVSLMSKLNGKAIVGHPLTVEALNSMEGDLGKTVSQQNLPKKKKNSKKTKKKKMKLGLVPKKIRKLSSLTGNKKSEERKPVLEKSKGPVIACIPLKLVFSRINEAVNGSARQSHRV